MSTNPYQSPKCEEQQSAGKLLRAYIEWHVAKAERNAWFAAWAITFGNFAVRNDYSSFGLHLAFAIAWAICFLRFRRANNLLRSLEEQPNSQEPLGATKRD